jgi:uncharacterized RDD family membrane protein YckC
MEQILDSPVNVRALTYAGFWIRAAALLIDGLIIGAVYAVFAVLISIGSLSVDQSPVMMFTFIGIIFLAILLYFPLFESSAKQATPGKMAVGIKVGKANGEQISFLNALGRYFSKFISQLILYIGYMMAGWDPKKQALHDKIADTYVFYA